MSLFEELEEMYKNDIIAKRNSMEGEERFKEPNWNAHTQYLLGYIQGLKAAKGLIPKRK